MYSWDLQSLNTELARCHIFFELGHPVNIVCVTPKRYTRTLGAIGDAICVIIELDYEI